MTTFRVNMDRGRRVIAMMVAITLLTLGMVAATSSTAARADTDPPSGTPETVSADALPTWQINGVVWSQVTIGNTVYAAGEFSQARPPGVPEGGAGSRNVGNLIAYNITTGNLITSFNHTLNAQAMVVTKSPDNSRIYVGGDFTTVDGQARSHIAAFDVATGDLDPSFHPTIRGTVKAITATNSTVYAGGQFASAGPEPRTRLAAFKASNGALLPWAPATDGRYVWSMVMTPDQSKVVIGGMFEKMNGQVVDGMAAVDATSGDLVPWAASTKIPDAIHGSIMGLSTDGTNIYGSGFAFGSGASFEGEFSLDPSDGSINWLNDCQGDTYDTHPMNGALYTVSHVHNCEMIGGLTQLGDWSINQRHALAFSTTSSGEKNRGPDQYGWDYRAYDHSDLLTWYPEMSWGNYTQQGQSGWSVTGNGEYLAIGGEFLAAGGVGQQGLVRYAVKGKAPNKQGPAACYGTSSPKANALPGGIARVSWEAATDKDNARLTYKVYRSGKAQPVYTTTESSQYWDCPQMSFVDTGLSDGSSYTYSVVASDSFGNTYTLPTTNSVTATGGSLSDYAQAVLQDGASNFWRLGESGGSAVNDLLGVNNATAQSVTRGADGPISGDPTTATTFNGPGTGLFSSDSYAVTNAKAPTTPSFSIGTWVKTTTSSGGKLVGYGSDSNDDSGSYDRHIYMDDSGHLVFGVYPGAVKTVKSPDTYNDGAWHYVVATLDQDAGMSLYVDGQKVASDASVTAAQSYSGYWHMGCDNLDGWPDRPSDYCFDGTLANVAIYPTALSQSEIQDQYQIAGGSVPNQDPTARFTSSVDQLKASFDGSASSDPDGSIASYSWDFGDGSDAGSGATPDHTYAEAGTYSVTLTVTDDDGGTDEVSHDVTATEPPANEAPTATFDASVEGLKATFDNTSTDPNGDALTYSWAFGDGQTSTSKSPTHSYDAAGDYTVKLTVTDPGGLSDSVSHVVTVSQAAPTTLASDQFQRNVAGGWGSLDTGGAWSTAGSGVSVNGEQGLFTIANPGSGPRAYAEGVSTTNADVHVQFSMQSNLTGGGMYVYVSGRRVAGGGDYRAKVWLHKDGYVFLAISRMDGNTEVATVPLTYVRGNYSPGDKLELRFDVTGTNPTTLRAKVWPAGTSEPSTWQVQATDSTSGMQQAGSPGMSAYLSGSATAVPATLAFDNLEVNDASTLDAQKMRAMTKGTKVQELRPVTKANAKKLHALSKWTRP